jgi:hypothetical protein
MVVILTPKILDTIHCSRLKTHNILEAVSTSIFRKKQKAYSGGPTGKNEPQSHDTKIIHMDFDQLFPSNEYLQHCELLECKYLYLQIQHMQHDHSYLNAAVMYLNKAACKTVISPIITLKPVENITNSLTEY